MEMPRKLADRINLYFTSFESLEADIQNRANIVGPECLSKPNVQTGIAVLYLSWIGFKKESIPEVKKGDILAKRDAIWDSTAFKSRDVPHSAMIFLRNYANASVYMRKPGLSQYLVRNRNSMQLTETGVALALRTLNTQLFCGERNYSLIAIYESGVFYRAMAHQDEFPLYRHNVRLTSEAREKYERIFERKFQDVSTVTEYLKRYYAFVEQCKK